MSYLIGTPPEQVCDEKILSFVKPGVKASSKEIPGGIHGYEFIGVQRDKLQTVQMHMNDINKCISLIDDKLFFYHGKYSGTLSHLATMPGISLESALYILGEIGADMSVWWDSDQLVSWAGLSPANNASAGRKNPQGSAIAGIISSPCWFSVPLPRSRTRRNSLISIINIRI